MPISTGQENFDNSDAEATRASKKEFKTFVRGHRGVVMHVAVSPHVGRDIVDALSDPKTKAHRIDVGGNEDITLLEHDDGTINIVSWPKMHISASLDTRHSLERSLKIFDSIMRTMVPVLNSIAEKEIDVAALYQLILSVDRTRAGRGGIKFDGVRIAELSLWLKHNSTFESEDDEVFWKEFIDSCRRGGNVFPFVMKISI